MNILQLHIDPVYPPTNGGETRVWKTAEHLSSFGEVWLACPWQHDLELPGGVRAVPLDTVLLRRKALRIYAWNALQAFDGNHPLNRLLTRAVLRDLHRQVPKVDVVVCETLQMWGAAQQFAERFDAKLLLTEHNADFDNLRQNLAGTPVPAPIADRAVRNLREYERQAVSRADAVVFQSESDRELFAGSWMCARVIPNGCDVDEIRSAGDPKQLREDLGIPSDTPVCLYVGSFDYGPNRDAAHFIARELAPAFPEVTFLLVGRDPPQLDRENVLSPGFVDDLPSALALSDIALCPLSTGSGTKLKMMDYLAAGLPIVTTTVGAAGISIEDGESALVRDDADGMREAIATLLSSEATRDRLSSNAAALGTQYDWEQLLSGYDSLLPSDDD
ncbi:glycosyltransferase family 4 protein [Halobium salinum]|uniref:Glycosyltransferase family 4 protein n=1 Tax=Halobium salinum TaxID=1364940 RepID=A0ABD5P9W9_9EURY|nr:glycosyltransferase family 4 protein [Halobium salinum]